MLRVQIFLMCLVFTLMSPLSIDFASSLVDDSAFWVRVQVKATGGTEPYRYYYTYMPMGWKQVREYLYIPMGHVGMQKQYLCRVVVRDKREEELAVALLFRTENGRVFLDQQVYAYWAQFEYVEPSQASSFVATIQPRVVRHLPSLKNQAQGSHSSQSEISEGSSGSPSVSQHQNLPETDSNPTHNPSKAPNYNQIPNQQPKVVIPIDIKIQQSQTIAPERSPSSPKSGQIPQKNHANQITRSTLKSAGQAIDDIFFRLPTIEELDRIILSVDILAISKTIQQVIVSELSCGEKIAYLSELFGRIQANVEMKRISLAKMKLIEQMAIAEISRLEKQLARVQGELQAMGLNSVRSKLQQEVILLEEAYEEYNIAVIESSLVERRLPLYQNQMAELEKQRQIERKQARILQQRKANSTNKIESLKKQLEKEQKYYSQILIQISESDQTLEKIDDSIQILLQKASAARQVIASTPHRLDFLKRNYLIKQVQVSRIRQTIQSYRLKESKLKYELEQIFDQIQQQKHKIQTQQLEQSQSMIEALQRNLPNIQNQIDGLQFSCYEARQTIQNSSGEYLIKIEEYESYLERVYGIQSPIIAIRQEQQKQVLNLTHLSVYSSQWKQNYGEAILKAQIDESEVENFTCLQPSALQSMMGVIKSISKNLIIVHGDDGNIYKLYLGSCSRIEAVDRIPVVGDRIVFKGTKKAELTFNIYSVSSL